LATPCATPGTGSPAIPAADSAGERGRWRHLRVALGVCVWLYLGALVAVWALMYAAGDRWWLATLVLFGPRWVWGLPLAVLVPAVVAWRRWRWLGPLAASALILGGPLMGLCVPWAMLSRSDGPRLRVLSCNVKGHCRGNAVLNALVRQASPDLVALQGCWGEVRVEWPPGWHVERQGEMLIASRFPLYNAQSVLGRHPPHRWPRVSLLDCVVDWPSGPFRFVSVHLPSPHHGISQVLDRETVIDPSRRDALDDAVAVRRQASEEASNWASGLSEPLVLAGDFNMPVESPIYRNCWARFSNAFSRSGFGFGYTEWPTVGAWRFGIRIDHVLTGRGWRARRSWVGPDVGSDHLPLVCDLMWEGPAPRP